MIDCIGNSHTLEVINLTTAQDGWQNLVFFCRSQNEDDVCRRLFQRFQESVEGCCRQHVYLVDDKHLVTAYLRWDARLVHQRLDVVNRVVGGSVQLKNVVRTLFVERLTTLTLVACLTIVGGVHTVDGFGEDTSTRRLTHTTRSAEQIGMCQLSAFHGILQGGGQCCLSHNRVECHRTVFTC